MIFYNAYQTEDKILDYNIFLGAILHDIGKFYMRTENSEAKITISREYDVFFKEAGKHAPRHEDWGAYYVQQILPERFKKEILKDVTNLILYHHKPSSYGQYLISVADKISASVDRKDIEEDDTSADKSKYLISILSQICLDQNEKSSRKTYYKNLTKRYEIKYPTDSFYSNARNDYQNLWKTFLKKP